MTRLVARGLDFEAMIGCDTDFNLTRFMDDMSS